MKDIGLDFGLLIAYLIPGGLAIWGWTFWNSDLANIVALANQKDAGGAALAGLMCLALMAGMLISVVRAGIIDKTFSIKLDRIPGAEISLSLSRPPIERTDPIYSRLATQEKLAAYLEAKASDKRPYQFYGNSLLALLIFVPSYIAKKVLNLDFGWSEVIVILSTVVALCFLYLAARNSHARFALAVADLNRESSGAARSTGSRD